MGLCKAVIIGHLGRDPEMKYSDSGLAIASFSVAATEKVKGQDRTEWFKVTAFGKLGEICGQYLVKGKQVYIEGKLRSNEYEKRDGTKGFAMEIIASDVQMIGSGGKQGAGQTHEDRPEPQQYQQKPPVVSPSASGDDDIPF